MEHTVRAYDEELDALTAELARMGGLAESAVADAIFSTESNPEVTSFRTGSSP